MPAKSEKQAKFMRACLGDKPKKGCPPKSVARKFTSTKSSARSAHAKKGKKSE